MDRIKVVTERVETVKQSTKNWWLLIKLMRHYLNTTISFLHDTSEHE